MSKNYEEEFTEEVMEEEEVKESKLKVLASKAKSKINGKKIAKTLAVGAGLIAAYALGTKTGKGSGSDYDFATDLDTEEVDVIE